MGGVYFFHMAQASRVASACVGSAMSLSEALPRVPRVLSYEVSSIPGHAEQTVITHVCTPLSTRAPGPRTLKRMHIPLNQRPAHGRSTFAGVLRHCLDASHVVDQITENLPDREQDKATQ